MAKPEYRANHAFLLISSNKPHCTMGCFHQCNTQHPKPVREKPCRNSAHRQRKSQNKAFSCHGREKSEAAHLLREIRYNALPEFCNFSPSHLSCSSYTPYLSSDIVCLFDLIMLSVSSRHLIPDQASDGIEMATVRRRGTGSGETERTSMPGPSSSPEDSDLRWFERLEKDLKPIHVFVSLCLWCS